MAKNKLYWEKEKKREKEGKKREKEKRKKKRKKRRKRERKRKKGINGGGCKQIKKKSKKRKEKRKEKKKPRGVSSDSVYLSPLTSPGTCPSSWSSGGGACFADFQVLALGGAALPSAWCRAQLGLFNP